MKFFYEKLMNEINIIYYTIIPLGVKCVGKA